MAIMAVLPAQKLLEAIKKPDDCDFVVRVSDELITQNNGCYHVTKDGVTRVEQMAPDISVTERSLAQMAVGSIRLEEAMLRRDVEVFSKEEMLRRVFTEKSIFVGEHF